MKRVFKVIVIIILIFILSSLILYKLMNSRTFQVFGDIISQLESNEKVVALTFDDGPTERTGEILKVLDEVDVKTTFFLTGKEIESNMEEAKQIVEAGHEIGNHSYSHSRMVFKSYSFISNEIEQTDKLIREAGYRGEIYFRPPFGKKLFLLPYYLNKNNRKTIMWNIEPDSYYEIATNKDNIVEHINDNIKPGSIILLHVMYENKSESLDAIKDIVETLRAKGYQFKTISELRLYKNY